MSTTESSDLTVAGFKGYIKCITTLKSRLLLLTLFTCGFGSLPLLHGIRVGHRERGHGADGLSLLRVSPFGFQHRKPQPRRVALHRAPVLTWEDGADKRQEGEKTTNAEEVNKSKALRGLTLNIWSSHENEPERILKSKNRYSLIKMLQTLFCHREMTCWVLLSLPFTYYFHEG